jgi:simple sugar transport system ATP-binding protein
MCDEGLAVLVVSSKLDELQSLSDRIAVMYEGEFVDVVSPDEVTEHDLGLLMTGRGVEAESTTSAVPDGGDG